jgi:hypothetical protein
MESSVEDPPKATNRTSIPSSNTTPGHASEETKSGYSRDACPPVFVATLLSIIAKLCKHPRSPTVDEWITKV